MNKWQGKAIFGIGLIHTVFGVVVFWPELMRWLSEGLWNTVSGQAEREWAFWFIGIGFLAMLLGFFVDWVERKIGYLPAFLGWGLFLESLIGVIIMPVSGLWLLLITSLFIINSKKHS
jgi:hypothetical protein